MGTLRALICAHQYLDQVSRRNSQFCHSDMSHWESRICIKNEKLQKRKTSAPGKIQYLGAHVFGNAKLFLVFRILDSQIPKCFFPKPLIATHLNKKIVKTHVKMGDKIWTASGWHIRLTCPKILWRCAISNRWRSRSYKLDTIYCTIKVILVSNRYEKR